MTLRSRYLTGIVALVVIQLLTAFGAVGLLTRMSPAVQEILAQNVYSTEAAEDALMAVLLGLEDDADHPRERFLDAVSRARQNVTEDGEVPAIDDLERWGRLALAGQPGALSGVVEAAERLTTINREAMQRASTGALNLGNAGAWAAVALTLGGFLISIVVARHTIFGVLEPVEELEDVLRSYRAGDRYRRCQGRAASQEMRRVLSAVNTVLDHANRVDAEKLDASDD
jgi:hypothetical protein